MATVARAQCQGREAAAVDGSRPLGEQCICMFLSFFLIPAAEGMATPRARSTATRTQTDAPLSRSPLTGVEQEHVGQAEDARREIDEKGG